MNIREKIARFIAPSLQTEGHIKSLISTEVERVKAALPITASYDPNGEGYRRLAGSMSDRNLQNIDQDTMFEIAYWMWDKSAMFRRLNLIDNDFIFGDEFIQVTAKDINVQKVIDDFWNDPENKMDTNFSDRMMWFSVLGEQCFPVEINPSNGRVIIGYVDPTDIKDIWIDRNNVTRKGMVQIKDAARTAGKKMQIIKIDKDPAHKKSFGRLAGDCFFYAVNNPPNSPRGRSDYLTLFDWIDGLERYSFNYLSRAEDLLNFIWDVTLQGMGEDKIREWMSKNSKPPEPGSVRAHNENVTWAAVAPDLNATDIRSGYEMGRSFVMGASGRPDSWFGTGGKAYQNEADLMGLVPIKDLGKRQNLYAVHLKEIIQFVIDQAIIAGKLSVSVDTTFQVKMPQISKTDTSKIASILTPVTTSLMGAKASGWITNRTASKIYVGVCNQLGEEINAEEEFKAAQAEKQQEDDQSSMQDYIAMAKAKQAIGAGSSNEQGKDIRGEGQRINRAGE